MCWSMSRVFLNSLRELTFLGLTLPQQPSTAKYNLPTSENTCTSEVCEKSTSQATPELEVVKTLNEMEVYAL